MKSNEHLLLFSVKAISADLNDIFFSPMKPDGLPIPMTVKIELIVKPRENAFRQKLQLLQILSHVYAFLLVRLKSFFR